MIEVLEKCEDKKNMLSITKKLFNGFLCGKNYQHTRKFG